MTEKAKKFVKCQVLVYKIMVRLNKGKVSSKRALELSDLLKKLTDKIEGEMNESV